MKYNKIYYYDKDGIRKKCLGKNLDTKEIIAALKDVIWECLKNSKNLKYDIRILVNFLWRTRSCIDCNPMVGILR